MKKTALYILLLISLNQVFAQYHFVENKGQWPNKVKFRINYHFAQIYFEKNCFTYNILDEKSLPVSAVHHGYDHKSNIIKGHAYQMQFVNSNQNVYIAKGKRSTDYRNYFVGKKENWASNVYAYKQIRYENIYDGIDINVKYNKSGIKYDFICSAGSNPDLINIKFKGTDKIKIENKKLVISTSVGNIIELEPYAYQIINGEKQKVECSYVLKSNNIKFKLANYNHNYDLIIDPTLIFSTYSGSTSDNWGFTATFDSKGNVYSGGIVFGSGYPSSLGAYQYNFNGGEYVWTYVPNGCDIAIIKYNSTGDQRLWATYLGGSTSEELPHSLVVNNSDELYIFGTTSSSDFPTTAGAYDQTFNGGQSFTYDNVVKFTQGSDIFISKLSEDGSQLLASTFVGGSGNDGINYKAYINSNSEVLMHGNDSLYYNYADGARGEIIVDNKSFVYVATSTFSTDFPTLNAFQPNSAGKQEGVVFKLNSDLTSMMWSSYLGGSEDDGIYSIDIDSDNDVYVGGGTVSHDFPTTQGAYNTNFNGGTTDGFVAHISANGQQLIASTYFGAQDYDQIYFVRLDKQRNVYVTGQTKNPGTALIYNAGYNSPNSGQFVTKFTNDLGGIIYSTCFGTGSGKPNISITAFAVDVCNRIYLSGWGREWPGSDNYTWNGPNGTTGMDVTGNAYQSTTDAQDFYLMVLHDDASSLDYATFFGEPHTSGYCGHDHVDGGTSRFDKKGHIYQSVCASCGNYGSSFNSPSCNDFPTTPGVWSEDNGGIVDSLWECNNAVFTFSFIDDITAADFHFPGNGCAPYTVQFTNSSMGNHYFWDFGDGTTSTDVNPTHTFQAGTWDITLIAVDSGTCNISDTIVKTINVVGLTQDTFDIKHICIGDSVQIGINQSLTGATYQWTPSLGLSNPNISQPWASPLYTTNYHLNATYPACLDVDQQVVVHQQDIDVVAYPDTGVCPGEIVTFYAQANDSTISWQWYNTNNPNDILSTNDSLQITVNQQGTYVVNVNENYCNVNATDTVSVYISPLSINLTTDTIICYGDTINLHASSINPNDTVNYSWTPTSQIISGENTSSPLVAPLENSVYYVSAVNQNGCSRNDSVRVFIDSVASSLNIQNITCFGYSDGIIQVNNISGYQPYNYIWSNGEIGQSINNLSAGNYTVTISDSLNCTDVLSGQISEPPLLEAQITDIHPTGCGSNIETGSISVNAWGGTPDYTYVWNTTDTTNVLSNLPYGIYTVTIYDNNMCDTVLSATITDPSTLQISETHVDALCFNDCNGSVQINIDTPSVAPYTYVWDNGQTVSYIDGLCFGYYNVSVYDADTCMRQLSVHISQPDSIYTQIQSQGIVCHNDTADAFAQVISGGTPGFVYQWNDGTTGQSISGLTEGEYYVVVKDANNCIDTTYLTLVNPPELLIDSSQTEITCHLACNGTAVVNVSGGVPDYNYVWSNGSTDSLAVDLCSGYTYVTVSDANGCTKVLEFLIKASEQGLPVSAWADDYIIYNDESTTLHSIEGNYTYTWSPSSSLSDYTSQNPIASPKQTTLYTVTVSDEYGCTNTDTVLIKVKEIICGEPYIYVPNAFTPNGDGKNDILYAYGDIIEELYFAIYDRWGELIFETDDITKGWDGTYKGKKLDPAVFVYYIKAVCRNNETFIKKGNITLLR